MISAIMNSTYLLHYKLIPLLNLNNIHVYIGRKLLTVKILQYTGPVGYNLNLQKPWLTLSFVVDHLKKCLYLYLTEVTRFIQLSVDTEIEQLLIKIQKTGLQGTHICWHSRACHMSWGHTFCADSYVIVTRDAPIAIFLADFWVFGSLTCRYRFLAVI